MTKKNELFFFSYSRLSFTVGFVMVIIGIIIQHVTSHSASLAEINYYVNMHGGNKLLLIYCSSVSIPFSQPGHNYVLSFLSFS